jgi:hypothetical protein
MAAHPTNKYERMEIGKRKGSRRTFFIWKDHNPESLIRNADRIATDEQQYRDRTTSCPCHHCRASRAVRGPSVHDLRANDMLVEAKASVYEIETHLNEHAFNLAYPEDSIN